MDSLTLPGTLPGLIRPGTLTSAGRVISILADDDGRPGVYAAKVVPDYDRETVEGGWYLLPEVEVVLDDPTTRAHAADYFSESGIDPTETARDAGVGGRGEIITVAMMAQRFEVLNPYQIDLLRRMCLAVTP